ncbi:odv-e26 [Antheraea pernyi nucleopolyhedrovirus]|uniref:Occlusion-derived virus envelope protein E26 n=2 Tax=Antheraea pernyi nuclear polyhedrosis virus TaxID=161494 RepID=Q1HGW8_NPVAP|nr:odv-e26 [Antheraea pernyi nucleopolyhedrovirus]AWD33654.1 occlusion-derived virus envelope protein E26 [Antheraea proylei nucleopolyhedrovirus]BBD50593.1 occlusion-derived virus envelope protein E26 [Antheraea yamamai nucleopolyhedrovirus]BBD50745.1 occlusion-derived virus envelope protein E26 [Samia cynthia nucleopolyhedrovirus]ABF50362.1 odv-e26 [Antheraea pernyi nucleopolyhedrovirus]AYW35481.1 odv-e26 [Antheraea proylei nucleopolyhedrovirus]
MEMLPPAYLKRAASAGAVRATFVKTVVTTTTVENRSEEQDLIAQVIAQLQKTRICFNKLSRLQRKRVRNMQKLLRKKNTIIANLTAQLNNQQRVKHFAAVLCKNVVCTVSGSEKFVDRRVADLCAAGGERVFCGRRTDCARDRQRLAEALAASLRAGVVARASNKRFKILEADKVASAKLIVQQVLYDGLDGDACAH